MRTITWSSPGSMAAGTTWIIRPTAARHCVPALSLRTVLITSSIVVVTRTCTSSGEPQRSRTGHTQTTVSYMALRDAVVILQPPPASTAQRTSYIQAWTDTSVRPSGTRALPAGCASTTQAPTAPLLPFSSSSLACSPRSRSRVAHKASSLAVTAGPTLACTSSHSLPLAASSSPATVRTCTACPASVGTPWLSLAPPSP
mmetsp:Transcript_28759/g.66385  ORF Transcript_28759/g.66385 Transcript_28759/m.66385 type:complete len:200 (-) Transcript_28759:1058-1657(-)